MDIKLFSMLFLAFSHISLAKILKGSQTRFQDVVQELIETTGYQSEVHQVETEDGYLLKVHRILPKNVHPRTGPVFFMHGLFATAADYIVTGADKALPFLLSSNGYDIWLGNSRGNDHGLNHKKYKSTSKEFWDFSWHEIGYYDVPAMIDYLLEQTNSSKTFYVGHSQGTTSCMVMLSTRPEYNAKIIQTHLLAPAVFMKYFPNPAINYAKEIRNLAKPQGYFDISKKTPFSFIQGINAAWCREGSPILGMCEASIAMICGKNTGEVELDTTILPTLLNHMSHYASVRQFEHFLQIILSGQFRQYDFERKNMKIYGSSSPPLYKIQNVVAPTYIYCGSCDAMVAERDIENLREALPNVRGYKCLKNYNHCDFNYGKNSRALYQNDILKTMNSEQSSLSSSTTRNTV